MKKPSLSIFSKIRTAYSKDISPERDWAILLIVAVVMLSISVALHTVIFVDAYKGESITGTSPKDTAQREMEATRERLEAIEEIFNEREQVQQEYLRATRGFIDPARN